MMKRIKILKTLRIISFGVSVFLFILITGAKGSVSGTLFVLFFVFLSAGSLMGKAIQEIQQKERVRLIAKQKDDFYHILEAP